MGKNEEIRITVYQNQINASLKNLTARDNDLLMAVAHLMDGKGNQVIKIGYTELMSLANWRHISLEQFHNYLKHEESISKVQLYYEDNEGNVDKAVIFSRFTASRTSKMLTLKVNNEFVDLFSDATNGIVPGFTAIDLAISTDIESNYTKMFYENLCRYRNAKTGSGWWEVSIDEFKELFGVPEAYKTGKRIRDKIIEPAIKALAPYMNITCKTLLKGRKTVGYRFDYSEVGYNPSNYETEADTLFEWVKGNYTSANYTRRSAMTHIKYMHNRHLTIDDVHKIMDTVAYRKNTKSFGASVTEELKAYASTDENRIKSAEAAKRIKESEDKVDAQMKNQRKVEPTPESSASKERNPFTGMSARDVGKRLREERKSENEREPELEGQIDFTSFLKSIDD